MMQPVIQRSIAFAFALKITDVSVYTSHGSWVSSSELADDRRCEPQGISSGQH